jgi:hypothetical protein
MATPTLITGPSVPCILDCGCPNCGEALISGLLEVDGGETVETVTCPQNCDLRPFIFREPADACQAG